MRRFADGQWMEWWISRLPLPGWVTARIRRLFKDEDKPSWQKQLLRNTIKFSFIFKILFSTLMFTHLALRYGYGSSEEDISVGDNVFSIVVITRNEPKMLQRCLDSLDAADYGGDKVDLSVWVLSKLGLFTSFDRTTLSIVNHFKWKHGEKDIKTMGQTLSESSGLWPNAFTAVANESNLLFVQDSAVFSPMYYRWFREMHKNYALEPERSRVAGVALENIVLPKRDGRRWNMRAVESESDAFAYSFLPDVAAFAPDLNIWKEFGQWLQLQQTAWFSHPVITEVDDLSRAVKGGTSEYHWSLWYSQFLHEYKMYIVYPNLNNGEKALVIRDKLYSGDAASNVLRKKMTAESMMVDANVKVQPSAKLLYLSVDGSETAIPWTGALHSHALRSQDSQGRVAFMATCADGGELHAANWLCNVRNLELEDAEIFVFGGKKSELVDKVAHSGESAHVVYTSEDLTSESACLTALELLRANRTVIISDVDQIWVRVPSALRPEAIRTYDLGVAYNEKGAAVSDVFIVTPSLKSRLMVHSVCSLTSHGNRTLAQELTDVSAVHSDITSRLHMSVRDIARDVGSVPLQLSGASTDRLPAVITGIDEQLFKESAPRPFVYFNETTQTCISVH